MRQLRNKSYCLHNNFAIFCVILFCFITIIGFLLSLGLSYCFGGSLSSWFQAIGTIFAVISGFVLAVRQTSIQQKQDEKRVTMLAETTYLLTLDAFDLVCNRLQNKIKPEREGLRKLQKPRTEEMIQIMKDFQIVHVPTKMLRYFIQIRVQLTAMNKGIDTYSDTGKEEDLKSTWRVLDDAKKSWCNLKKVADDYDFVQEQECDLTKEYQELFKTAEEKAKSRESTHTGC